MGNSLHNKIYLGRRPVFDARRLRVVLGAGALVGVGVAWMVLHSLK